MSGCRMLGCWDAGMQEALWWSCRSTMQLCTKLLCISAVAFLFTHIQKYFEVTRSFFPGSPSPLIVLMAIHCGSP